MNPPDFPWRASPEGAVPDDREDPGFLEELVADLVEVAGLVPGNRVLEIGCGTGRMSLHLAHRGLRLLALELRPEVAAVARRRLTGFPNTEVAVTAYERWRSTESFDAVVCDGSFDGLNPLTGLDLFANRLRLPGAGRSGGALAVLDTRPVAGGDDGTLRELHVLFGRWACDVRCPSPLPSEDELPPSHPELSAVTRFSSHISSRRYVWERSRTAAEHLDLLRLRAGTSAPGTPVPVWLRESFETVVARNGSTTLVQRYVTDLRVATRAR